LNQISNYLFGIDIVVDKDKNVQVLEVNDAPSTLFLGNHPNKKERRKLKKILLYLKKNSIEAIFIQLSEQYVAKNSKDINSLVVRSNDSFLCQLKFLEKYFEDENIQFFFIRNLSDEEKNYYKKNFNLDKTILIRRGLKKPELSCKIILNELYLRNLTRDKLLTSKVLKLSEINSVQCLGNEEAKEKHIINKPRFGYGSNDINLNNKIINNEEIISQLFIEYDFLEKKGFKYKYDIRVNVLNGKVINEFIRISSIPFNSVFNSNEEAVWLTTSGEIIERSEIIKKLYKMDIPWKEIRQIAINASKEIVKYKFNLHTNIDPYKKFREKGIGLIT